MFYKKIKSHTLVFLIGVLVPCVAWIISITMIHAFSSNKTATEQRALYLEQKECYTWQEIEYVVFGEIQE